MECEEANSSWGIDQDWDRTADWLKFRGPIVLDTTSVSQNAKVKCPEIPVLASYEKDPGDSFWDSFPSKELPTKPVTPICIEKFESLVNSCSTGFTCHQMFRAKRCLEALKKGASAYQVKKLPGVH